MVNAHESDRNSLFARRLALALPRHKLAELTLIPPSGLERIERGIRPPTGSERTRLDVALSMLEQSHATIRAHTLAALAEGAADVGGSSGHDNSR